MRSGRFWRVVGIAVIAGGLLLLAGILVSDGAQSRRREKTVNVIRDADDLSVVECRKLLHGVGYTYIASTTGCNYRDHDCNFRSTNDFCDDIKNGDNIETFIYRRPFQSVRLFDVFERVEVLIRKDRVIGIRRDL